METITVSSTRIVALTEIEIFALGVLALGIVGWQLLLRLRAPRNR